VGGRGGLPVMQTILPKLLVIGLLAGGFSVTGDLGWLARRGRRLLEASTVPTESVLEPGTHDAPEHDPGAHAGTAPDSPTGAATGGHLVVPPTGGPASVDLATLASGERLVVWVMRSGGRAPEPVTLDLIDPQRGAVLLQRAAEPPRRVRVISGSSGILGRREGVSPALTVRATLVAQPLGLAHGTASQPESYGRIVAFTPAH